LSTKTSRDVACNVSTFYIVSVTELFAYRLGCYTLFQTAKLSPDTDVGNADISGGIQPMVVIEAYFGYDVMHTREWRGGGIVDSGYFIIPGFGRLELVEMLSEQFQHIVTCAAV